MRLKSRLNVILKSDMEWIHEASLKILSETGIVFQSEEALTICRNHGAKVDGKTVCFPNKLVRQVLGSSPKTFRWRARNDDQSMTVADENERLLIQPNAGPVFIQDLDHGRRKATLKDFANIIKLCQASDIVNLVGSFPEIPKRLNRESG